MDEGSGSRKHTEENRLLQQDRDKCSVAETGVSGQGYESIPRGLHVSQCDEETVKGWEW